MSLCRKFHSWFRKEERKKKHFEKTSRENTVRDVYCPVNFEKMLRNYSLPSETQKVQSQLKTDISLQKYSPTKILNEENVEKEQSEDIIYIPSENEKENENKQNAHSFNMIPKPIENEKLSILGCSKNLNILQDLQDIESKNDIGSDNKIFSPPPRQISVLPFHPVESNKYKQNYSKLKYLFEKVVQNVEQNQNIYEYPNKAQTVQVNFDQFPELKTKLSLRTIENKIKKGYSLRKIANQLIHYKHFQFCQKKNIKFEELHQSIMLFLKKKFSSTL